MGAWGLRPRQAVFGRSAAEGGGSPITLLAPLSRGSCAVICAYRTSHSGEYPHDNSACICVCNAGIFCCRQCVPKAFGRTAIRLVFSSSFGFPFIKFTYGGRSKKGVTSDTSKVAKVHLCRLFCFDLARVCGANSQSNL